MLHHSPIFTRKGGQRLTGMHLYETVYRCPEAPLIGSFSRARRAHFEAGHMPPNVSRPFFLLPIPKTYHNSLVRVDPPAQMTE